MQLVMNKKYPHKRYADIKSYEPMTRYEARIGLAKHVNNSVNRMVNDLTKDIIAEAFKTVRKK